MGNETLLAITIYYFLGHAWFSYSGNTPRRALDKLYRIVRQSTGDDSYTPGITVKALALTSWALVGPVFWWVDMFNNVLLNGKPKKY
ncbi:hypothetical protein ACFVYR_05210 [Streptomyces sp. NPDC058284]|uniref:hypothetical protein n=1 Tax=unclassified Streptomyces TaxID=2593676 RepID=UPI0036527C97